jgi:uncharacterized protein (DUF302 family)
MNHPSLITRTSSLSLETVCRQLPEIAQRHKFGVLGVHDLKEKMTSKGVPFARECRVFEVCNPQQAQAVLNEQIAISTALPCRISVYEDGGQTVLATIKPDVLLTLFDAAGATQVAREVEDSLVRIMEETCASPVATV